MAVLKPKPEKISRLLESGVTRQEDDPGEAVRKSRFIRARSAELLDKSRKLIENLSAPARRSVKN